MFCGKCGKQIDDDVNICPNCGNSLKPEKIENAETERVETNLKRYDFFNKVSKKYIIAAIILIIIISIPVIYFSMASTKIINCMEAGNYKEAEGLYYDNYQYGEGDFLLNKGLLDIAEKCKEDFISSEINSEDAFELINTIKNININDIRNDIDEIYSSINDLSADRNLIEKAEEYYSDGNYLMATSQYNSLSKDSPLYEGVAGRIGEVMAEYKNKVLQDVDTYINSDKSIDLAEYISNNIYNLNDSTLTSEIMEKYYSYLQTKIDKFLADNLYDSAVSFLSSAQSYFGDDKKIDDMSENLENNYVKSSLKKAEEEFNSGNYEAAASTVQVAMQQIEDNEELANKYDEYKAYLPAYINDLDYFDKNGDIHSNSDYSKVADNTGKTYSRAYCVGYRDGFADYLINENYTNFEGTCGVAYQERTNGDTKFFEVYGDGVLIYTSPVFTSGTMPSTFNVDVTGVKVLRIKYPDGGGYCKIASIFDGKLYNSNNISQKDSEESTLEAAN